MNDISQPQIAIFTKKSSTRGMVKVLVGLLVLIISGGSILWALRPTYTAEVYIVRKGEAISAVYGTVSVEPVSQTIIRSQSAGTVSAITVKIGDVVKQGNVLAEVSDENARLQVRQSSNELDTEKKRQNIGPPTTLAVKAKKAQLEQLEKLLKEGNISKSEYQRNLTELQTLEERVKTEQLALDAAVATAEQKLETMMNLEKQRLVLAPQDGVILEIYSQIGEVTTLRAQMFLIGSTNCHLKAQVNEEDVGSLKEEMKAMVRLYAYPHIDFPATLKEILPQGNNQAYRVLLSLDQPPQRLLPGMTGELNIITGIREKSLIIPSSAIRNGNMVLVVNQGIVGKRLVKTGYRTIEKTEILEGLQEGDHVILSDHDLFKVGQKVQEHVRKTEGA